MKGYPPTNIKFGDLTEPRSDQSSGTHTPIFDEVTLGAEITRMWGMYGAHAEVFGMMLAERKALLARVKELEGVLEQIYQDDAESKGWYAQLAKPFLAKAKP